MITGVYCIKNILTGKVYIGSSKDITWRLYQHFWLLENNTHCNIHLQRAYNKSKDFFVSGIVEECAIKDLISVEQKWIDYYYDFSYNIRKVAESNIGIKMPIGTGLKIANANRGKKRTKEQCERISASKKGIKMTQDRIDNMKKRLKGRVLSVRELEAMRENVKKAQAALLKNPPQFERIVTNDMKIKQSRTKGILGVKVMSKTLDYYSYYNTIQEAADDLKINGSSISKYMRGVWDHSKYIFLNSDNG